VKVQIGAAKVNRSDLDGLRRAWRQGDLVICVGAGVSVSYGLPSWNNLVLELLFEQAQGTRRLGHLWPHYRRAVASWMTEYFDYNPLVLARMVERDLRARQKKKKGVESSGGDEEVFLERLREHLYANIRKPTERTSLDAIADLAAKNGKSSGVSAIVTFNFDDLLERELAKRGVLFHSIVSGTRPNGRGLRVIHSHGFIPAKGALSRDNVVFTEQDYHRLTDSVFHWALSEVVERLRKNTVLFVGLSMSDPNLRRLLDASRNSKIPPHWQIQKRHQIRKEQVQAVMTDVERRARDYSKAIGWGFDEQKKPQELEDSIHDVLRQADSYDSKVFASMGVKTIWIEEFDHVRDVIDAIAK
jgi:hypothetical protein